jgi:hypothetical protein
MVGFITIQGPADALDEIVRGTLESIISAGDARHGSGLRPKAVGWCGRRKRIVNVD